MKKVRICLAFCMILTLLLGACGTAQTGTEPTSAPETTKAPEVNVPAEITETPAPTEESEITEEPEITETPVMTDEPEITEVPAVTEIPVATEAPSVIEALEATEVPTATEAPKATATLRPTATPKLEKAPDKNGELTFTFSEMKYLTHFGCSYALGTDDVLKMSFDEQYAQLYFALPQIVDLSECEYITIKAKSEYASLSAKLLDERVHTDMWNSEIYARYDCIGDGIAEYELSPNMTAKIGGVVLMSSDEVEDFSKYKAEAYSITFHMKGEEGGIGKVKEQTMWGDVTYDFHDMTYVNSHGTTYKVKADGSLDVSFDGYWKEVRFAFPEAVDMNYCYGITVEADADSEITVRFFDKKFTKLPNCNEVFTLWNCNKEGGREGDKDGIYKYTIFPETLTELYGIGFVSSKDGVSYDDYKATVYSVTFHMASGTDWKVPKEIAPDVTEEMNFKNTYATVFEHFGATLSLQELCHPKVLELAKEQYTSTTMQCDFKPNFIFRWDHEFISVEEAKKQGYIIPKNYKEKTVPVLHFEYIDEILTICGENGIDMRGHTLLWHAETATWFFREGYSDESSFVSPEVMDARLEFYIRNVLNHVYNHEYGHIVYAWDVVNEYYHSDITTSDWLRVYGEQGLTPEFIKLAYEVADDVLHEHGIRDKVSLIYNDFNTYIEDEGTPDALISLIRFINSDGKICDGIGMQAHLDTYWPEDRSLFIKATQKFLDAGLEVQITEMDISIKEPYPNSEEDQRKAFERVFRDLLEVKKNGGNITVINMWGIGDHNSWLPHYTPLMFKNYDVPKDAYYAVLQAYLDAGFKVK